MARRLRDAVARAQILREARPAQIEVTIGQLEIFVA